MAVWSSRGLEAWIERLFSLVWAFLPVQTFMTVWLTGMVLDTGRIGHIHCTFSRFGQFRTLWRFGQFERFEKLGKIGLFHPFKHLGWLSQFGHSKWSNQKISENGVLCLTSPCAFWTAKCHFFDVSETSVCNTNLMKPQGKRWRPSTRSHKATLI